MVGLREQGELRVDWQGHLHGNPVGSWRAQVNRKS